MKNHYRTKILLELGYFVTFNPNAKFIISAILDMSSTLEPTLSSARHIVSVKKIFVG